MTFQNSVCIIVLATYSRFTALPNDGEASEVSSHESSQTRLLRSETVSLLHVHIHRLVFYVPGVPFVRNHSNQGGNLGVLKSL